MSSFKDMVARDNYRVFLRTDQFAEDYQIIWRGTEKTVKAVLVDGATGTDLNLTNTADGVYLGLATLHTDLREFGGQPEAGEWLRIRGNDYLIDSSENHMGMLTLGLKRGTE